MSSPLLYTKLAIPPLRPNLVSRQRLVEQLNGALQAGCKLVLISAPAGFGKTTLLSDWASQSQIPVAWVSLDESDNDPDRFLAYIVSALQALGSGSGMGEMALAMRRSPQPLPLESVVATLVNETAEMAEPFALALDDYHVISDSSIHTMVTFLLDHLPAQAHLVITTRSDPPLPLARLRARGQLAELRADDLRLTAGEVQAFLQAVMRLELSPAEAAALNSRTEGWVAGLQLAALALRSRLQPAPLAEQEGSDPADLIASLSGTHRYILDYLAEEVLANQPERVQTFLLRTSILDLLTAGLCNTLTGQDDGQFMLEELEAHNLFVFPLDGQRQWYRFHQLFGDFLRDRLATSAPEEVPALHRRAAKWLAAEGFTTEAIEHALAAGDDGLAARLIEEASATLLVRGEIATIIRWAEALPEEVVLAHPRLGLSLAWAILLREQARFWETFAERMAGLAAGLGIESGDVVQLLEQGQATAGERAALAEFAVLQAFVVRETGASERVITLFETALQHLPAEAQFARGLALGGLASTYVRLGLVAEAERAFAEAAAASQAANSIYGYVATAGFQALTQAQQGRLNQAADTYRRALSQLPDGHPLPMTGRTFVGLADVLREQNQLQEARRLATQGLEVGQQVRDIDALWDGHITLARVLYALGERDRAFQTLKRGEEAMRPFDAPGCLQMFGAWRARLSLAGGDIEGANSWAAGRSSSLASKQVVYDLARQVELLTLAQLLSARGEAADALPLLAGLMALAEQQRRFDDYLQTLVIQVLAYQALGRRGEAMQSLARALLLAEPGGYVRLFIDQGPPMAALLRSAAAQGHSPAYAQRLLALFSQATPGGAPLEPLSERELEVLRLVANGLTNAEIAQTLVIAPSTVKSHINHIYGKLGARNRTQAVAQARDLRLLD